MTTPSEPPTRAITPVPGPAADRPRARRSFARLFRWAPALLVLGAVAATPVFAAVGPDDDTLRLGSETYGAVCSACHQPGGAGIEGQYPPLRDNPNLVDEAYIVSVIQNGKTGPITVNGVDYDGVMPPQSTLSDEEQAAVAAYILSGFTEPAAAAVEAGDTGPVAGTELPIFANWMYLVGILGAIVIFGWVLAPRIVGTADRRTMPWLDAWLKTGIIVVGMIVATTIVPARVLETEAVRDLPRVGQDLIAVGLWALGLGGGLLAIWYAYRERRI